METIKLIQSLFKGIITIEHSEDSDTFVVCTKNAFVSLSKLEDIKRALGAKEIEVGIIATGSACSISRGASLCYTIEL